MEKRAIIAFALSFLVLLVWSYFTVPKKEPRVPEERGIPKETHETKPEPAPTPPPRPISPPDINEKRYEPIVPGVQEKVIKVETPLYKAIFSNGGAAIRSFKLKEYFLNTEPDSPLIELVKLKKNDEDFLKVLFDHQKGMEDGVVIYHSNEESIHLNPGSAPRDLHFSYLRPDGVSVDQTFRFYPDKYDIDLTIILLNNTKNRVEGNIKASLKNLPPKEKKSYYSFDGVALLLNDELEEIKPKKMEEGKSLTGRIEWMAYESGYFMSAVVPDDQRGGSFKGHVLPSGVVEATYIAPSITLEPLDRASSRFVLYMGPRELDILRQLGKRLDLAINFGFFDIIAKPLLYTLRFFNRHVHNYGIAIIILTILIKIIFWPLTHKSYKSMKEMQKLQPLMAKIKEKHKNNKEQMQRELMALYKTYKVNPMGGCLPMIIQIPVFFALFRILGNSIELRHAPFMLWITDLSAPDRLFSFPFKIPFMSPPYGIPVLTLLMGASMFIQQKMTPTPGDPSQAKIMMFLPIIFTVMFINFPSGLVLYWLINNVLSIGQQYRIKKRSA